MRDGDVDALAREVADSEAVMILPASVFDWPMNAFRSATRGGDARGARAVRALCASLGTGERQLRQMREGRFDAPLSRVAANDRIRFIRRHKGSLTASPRMIVSIPHPLLTCQQLTYEPTRG